MYTHLYTDTDNDQIWYSSTIDIAAEFFSNIVFLQKKKKNHLHLNTLHTLKLKFYWIGFPDIPKFQKYQR